MQSRHSDFKRKMVLFALMVLVVALVASTAFAHTGLSSTVPTEGESVSEPLGTISLSFTGTPTAVDDSVAVADAAGATVRPVSVEQVGNDVIATFDPPLGPGSYAVAWRVRSDDTHFIDGTFEFEVTALPASLATVPAVDVAGTTTAPPTTAAAAATPTSTSTVAKSIDDSAEVGVAEVAVAAPAVPSTTSTAGDASKVALSAPALRDGSPDEGEGVTRIGRLFVFPAAVVAVGMIAFAALAFAGRREELGTLIRAVRWLGVAVLFGALVEVVGLSSLLGGFGETIGDSSGRAAAARLLGGGLLVVGFNAVAETSQARRTRSLSAAVIERPDFAAAPAEGRSRSMRWRPAGLDNLGLVGAALIIVSFAFDGHTVTRGPRLLHGVASIMHVAGAAVWAGGLIALAVVLWRRQQDGVASHALEMVVRFSVLAIGALVLTGVAGVSMALFIDSDVLGYTGTEWGRLMMVKLVLVGAAALLGAYNHFRVLPALTAEPDDQAVMATTRRTVTLEAGLAVAAAAVTALLVAASIL
jgi:copper transport protein